MSRWSDRDATAWVIETGHTARYPLPWTTNSTREDAIKAWVECLWGWEERDNWRARWAPKRRKGQVRAVKIRLVEVGDG